MVSSRKWIWDPPKKDAWRTQERNSIIHSSVFSGN
jgi:hypothetical protein